MNCEEVLARLRASANPRNVEGMARFGIETRTALGLSTKVLEGVAKEIGKNHQLAQELWASGVHEARSLAAMIDEPKEVTPLQMENWVNEFDSWDICDSCCGKLFDKTKFAYEKAAAWSSRPEEFVKRAGFALMAWLAVHDKKAPDSRFRKFLTLIKRESSDERNFVKKAVNWALRQIGKRNIRLNKLAVRTAQMIHKRDSKAAKWISSDALRELTSTAVQRKIRRAHTRTR